MAASVQPSRSGSSAMRRIIGTKVNATNVTNAPNCVASAGTAEMQKL